MIKLGLMVCIKNDKYPENLKALCTRTDMFVRLWDKEDGDECEAGENVFDLILLDAMEERINALELELGSDPDVKFAERYEFEGSIRMGGFFPLNAIRFRRSR